MGSPENGSKKMWDELVRMVNDQFDTPQFRRLLSISFSRERAQQYSIQMAYYVNNRRDCWGYVQGAAPLDVKRMIWAHEQEELVHDPRAGTDHSTLATREGALLGLSAEDIETAELVPGAVAAFFAWVHLAKDRP